MAFLDKTGLQTLTNKLVQGDAIKVASHRGKNVKEVIDNIQRECENVALPNTMTLENRVNEFKIGQGRDVDVSRDVEEGKINVELQGKTWQNVVHGKKSVQSNIFTIEDGKYVFNNNATRSGGIVFSLICKPNTTYTLIINFLECALGDNTIYIDGHSVYLSTINKNLPKTKGTHAISFVTKDDVTDKKMKLAILNSSISKLVIDENIIVLEGDYTQTPIEELPKYFEGIKSSLEDGIVDIEVQGKNLVDLSKFNRVSNAVSQVNIVNNTISFSSSTRYNGVGQTFSKEEYKKMVGKYVTVSCGKITTSTGDSNDAYVFLKQSFVNSDGSTTWNNSTIASGQSKKIKILEGVNLTRFGIFVEPSNPVSGSIDIKAENIQLEIDSTSASYEPYYKKKISFNIEEPLRSLPNGICDEIRNNNGKWELVRKVGQKTLNGTENWQIAVKEEDYNTMYLNVSNIGNAKIYVDSSTIPNIMCDTLPVTSYNTAYYMSSDSSLMCITNRNNKTSQSIAIRMLNDTNTVEVLTNWLSENPITVYYELATYTVTPIEPIEFNISQGATVSINSNIAPISTYDAVLNRAGQIEQGIELIANLKSRINNLERLYDSNLIATQYRIDNLKLNYKLEREED